MWGQVQSALGGPGHPLPLSGPVVWSFHICELWVFPGGLAPYLLLSQAFLICVITRTVLIFCLWFLLDTLDAVFDT